MDSPDFEVDLRNVKGTLSRRIKEADTANMEMARMDASSSYEIMGQDVVL